MNEIKNTQVDNAKDIDVVIPMYNLIEYSNNYSKNILKSVAILQRWTILTAAYAIEDFNGANHYSKSFKFEKIKR